MRVEFLERFGRDLDAIKTDAVKKSVKRIIENVESANTPAEIHNLKKLKGHKSAFRIRSGDYRIGIFIDTNVVQFARVVHRKDIYKVFP
jgi:mRNA interferase RelE/StbE